MFFNRVVSSGGRVWFRVVLVVLMCFFSSVFVDGLYPKDYPLQIASKIAIDNIYSKRSLTLWLKLHPSLWEIHQLLWTHSMFQKGMIYVPRTTLGKFTMISPRRATWKIPPRPFTTFVGNFGQVCGIFPGYVVWDHGYFSRSDFLWQGNSHPHTPQATKPWQRDRSWCPSCNRIRSMAKYLDWLHSEFFQRPGVMFDIKW